MKYEGKRYKLVTASSIDSPVCNVCAFADINCRQAKQTSIMQNGKDCDNIGDYFIEDTNPIKKHNRKKLKFNNK